MKYSIKYLTNWYDDVTWREVKIGLFIIGMIIGAVLVWLIMA
jgi:hypothetical protein